MHWTQDAAERIRSVAGVVDASVVEGSDGLPGSRSFRAEVRLDSVADPTATTQLLDALLEQLHAAAVDDAPRGSVSLFQLQDGIRKNCRASRLPLPEGLRGWGSSVTVPEGWLHGRFA